MNPRDQKLLYRILTDHIAEVEKNLEHKLPKEDHDFLVHHCERIMIDSINKFADGSKRHGGHILDRHCLKELYMELLDAPIYLSAVMQQMKELSNANINL